MSQNLSEFPEAQPYEDYEAEYNRMMESDNLEIVSSTPKKKRSYNKATSVEIKKKPKGVENGKRGKKLEFQTPKNKKIKVGMDVNQAPKKSKV